jgi:hypothetical protein
LPGHSGRRRSAADRSTARPRRCRRADELTTTQPRHRGRHQQIRCLAVDHDCTEPLRTLSLCYPVGPSGMKIGGCQ